MRHDLARGFAAGNSLAVTSYLQPIHRNTQPITRNLQQSHIRPTPMEIDNNTSYYHKRYSPQNQYNPYYQQNKNSFQPLTQVILLKSDTPN